MEYTHIHIYHKQNQNSPTKTKYNILARQTKEIKNLCNSEEKNLEHMYTHG